MTEKSFIIVRRKKGRESFIRLDRVRKKRVHLVKAREILFFLSFTIGQGGYTFYLMREETYFHSTREETYCFV